MPDHVDSVRALLRLYKRWAKDADNKAETERLQTYEERIAGMEGVLAELEDLRQKTKPIPASYGDLSDLPPELLKELTGIKVDELEEQIYTVVKAGGDEADLDQVLIELYRRFGSVQTRKYLQNKLWRMAQKGLVYSVPNRKGVYSAQAQEAQESSSVGWSTAGQNPFETDLDDDVPF